MNIRNLKLHNIFLNKGSLDEKLKLLNISLEQYNNIKSIVEQNEIFYVLNEKDFEKIGYLFFKENICSLEKIFNAYPPGETLREMIKKDNEKEYFKKVFNQSIKVVNCDVLYFKTRIYNNIHEKVEELVKLILKKEKIQFENKIENDIILEKIINLIIKINKLQINVDKIECNFINTHSYKYILIYL